MIYYKKIKIMNPIFKKFVIYMINKIYNIEKCQYNIHNYYKNIKIYIIVMNNKNNNLKIVKIIIQRLQINLNMYLQDINNINKIKH